jgi:acetylglutamate kinase
MKHLIKKANLLTEDALPYIQKFKDKLFVIKYGGNAMVSDQLKISVMKDVALLKSIGIKIALVHGGGPNINEEMKQAGVQPVFVNGLRVTDQATLDMIVRIFKGINADMRNLLADFNIECEEVEACLISEQKNKELGFVGEVVSVDTRKINSVINKGKIPVISPIGVNKKRTEKYNINADTAATEVAKFLGAEKLTILTDVNGVMDAEGKLISHLSIEDVHNYITSGIITKGMIPKVEACVEAVESGCGKAHLINGTMPHALLLEIFTEEGIGTEIVKNGVNK